MPQTFNFTENNKLIIESEALNGNGELQITAKWNNVEISQTLPVRPEGPCQLCFDKESFNFFWIRLVPEDVRNDFETLRSYGA